MNKYQDELQQRFAAMLQERGICLNERQLDQFETYYQTLIEWNEKMNLTAITERVEVYWKHFFDSLSLAFFVDMKQVKAMADIGSGAGFPGIPLVIAFPEIQLTIVDSLNKRITFLNHLVGELGLNSIRCVHGRAEDVSRLVEHRDQYDLVTARAVAKLSVLNEFCLPFAKAGGDFVAMKGSDIDVELEEAAFSLRELRGELKTIHSMDLPFDQGTRHLIWIRKTGATPKKYPRKAGTPLKQPLGS